MIPLRLFWLSDLLVLALAFAIAYAAVPAVGSVANMVGAVAPDLLGILEAPDVGTATLLPPTLDLIWIFTSLVPATILILGATGGYRPLLDQSHTRVIVTGAISPLLALSLVALALFALQGSGWSRLFIFSFVLLGALALIVYRSLLRAYFRKRRTAGYYARNVLLIGTRARVKWLAEYFTEVDPQTYRPYGYLSRSGEGDFQFADIDLQRLGDIDAAGDLLIHRPIHEVVVVQEASDNGWITPIIRDCDQLGVVLRIVPAALLLGERETLRSLYPFEPLNLPAVVLNRRTTTAKPSSSNG